MSVSLVSMQPMTNQLILLNIVINSISIETAHFTTRPWNIEYVKKA